MPKHDPKLTNQLSLINSNAAKMSDTTEIAFTDLFPETFMKIHTNCTSIEEFLKPLNVQTNDDFAKLSSEQLDKHIQDNTNFDNWKDMQHSAWSDFLSERLGY